MVAVELAVVRFRPSVPVVAKGKGNGVGGGVSLGEKKAKAGAGAWLPRLSPFRYPLFLVSRD
jgi:hypothetical protein